MEPLPQGVEASLCAGDRVPRPLQEGVAAIEPGRLAGEGPLDAVERVGRCLVLTVVPFVQQVLPRRLLHLPGVGHGFALVGGAFPLLACGLSLGQQLLALIQQPAPGVQGLLERRQSLLPAVQQSLSGIELTLTIVEVAVARIPALVGKHGLMLGKSSGRVQESVHSAR